jgi:hypothetical protein
MLLIANARMTTTAPHCTMHTLTNCSSKIIVRGLIQIDEAKGLLHNMTNIVQTHHDTKTEIGSTCFEDNVGEHNDELFIVIDS